MSYKLVLARGEMERIRARFMPNREKMDAIGQVVSTQIDERFETEGASGEEPWKKPKWIESIGAPDGRKILQGIGNNLRKQFERTSDQKTTQIECENIAALVAQLGTKGKGGTLADPKAKAGKALFIAISDRAQRTRPITPFGYREKRKYDASLIKGKIVDGRLDPPNADFIFAPKVSIPARPVLPASEKERTALTDNVVKIIKDGPEA